MAYMLRVYSLLPAILFFVHTARLRTYYGVIQLMSSFCERPAVRTKNYTIDTM